MYLIDRGDSTQLLVTSASDLNAAAECEFGFARRVDALLGRIDPLDEPLDAMNERTIALGHAHEARLIEQYRAQGSLVDIDRPARGIDGMRAAQQATLDALHARTDMVVQATFFDPEHGPDVAPGIGLGFVGYADFLEHRGDGVYRVLDSKLARRAKVTALMQLAAYAEQLERLRIPVDSETGLILGNNELSIHRLDDIAPVHRRQRERMHALLRDRATADDVVGWRAPGLSHCGKCVWCADAIASHDDVWQTYGLRGGQWQKLADAGITTMTELVSHDAAVAGIPQRTLDALRAQAALQLRAAAGDPVPPVELIDASALDALPAPSAGDLFFDFEGDPLYTEEGTGWWGIDYLFGVTDRDDRFRPYWAHSYADERAALIAFLDDVERRLAEHPELHIYHYAPYEKTHLRLLAARHGIGEATVDRLLRDGVLVDLYAVVKRALRVGSTSYSIKKLEPLYWPESRLGAAVTAGDDSVAEYVRARDLRLDGQQAEAQRILDDIAEYNRIDCVSTRKLEQWLRAYPRGGGSGGAVGDDAGGAGTGADSGADDADPDAASADVPGAADDRVVETSPLHDELTALAANPDGSPTLEPDRTAEQRLYAYAAAAIDYHRREHKTNWWAHFDRLGSPLDEWADTRDVFLVDPDQPVTQTDWGMTGRQKLPRRQLRLHGQWAPGSRPTPGGRSGPFAVYEHPAPLPLNPRDPLSRPARAITLEAAADDHVVISETLASDPATGELVAPYRDLPTALTPAPPPDPGKQVDAIHEWGSRLVSAHPELPRDAVVDLLLRRPPRTRGGMGLAAVAVDENGEPDRISAVTESLLALDHSYLAVQGPPGTGKTYLGSRVIARLVAEHGWRVGVVAQGHATVEHVLDAVVAAGLDGAQVAKAPKNGADPAQYATARWTVLGRADQLAGWTAGQAGGYVIGGTAWDFANPARVERDSLDLLVIDEAGQYSLAATIAASVSARNLLLLGDPQQLPQVSQGTHPEPIDGSALGYLTSDHDVLPAELGYFLAETRRVHPALARHVSALSYEGELHAHPSAATRALDGVAPGIHAHAVEHHGNATESVDEAAVVVALVDQAVGLAWTDPTDRRVARGNAPRPLTAADVIVVTPYNAQVQTVRAALDAAGHTDTRVGTVDKFQGQEAVIAIVTLAASSAADAPRGLDFLLNRNRLNVAISRAQWAAHIVHAPTIADHLPHTPAGLAELSAFLRLID
ncbi:TM0106 family RecB-like putative nuclease [Microcella sp.]|uniref:TM0106 family RecB-like putative nuclease n=1 Tax=Microcella sp. TaxID=1913979 RepID=UPI003919EDC0